jgi:hypothetical protein
MFYAIHSTLNGIIPLLVVGIKGLMVLGDFGFGYYFKRIKLQLSS